MKRIHFLFAGLFLFFLMTSSTCNREGAKSTVDSAEKTMVELGDKTPKYVYETYPNDPMGVKIYTLKNGLKVYMSVNKDEPRIQTNIAVRAGSKHDPADATGLAHYLEHMMFKGTSNIGSLNWEKEKELLQQISDLYEQHRGETDPAKRKAIYAQIDQVSNDAAKLVAANEYDKMVGSLGAKGTNAYTWVEQTVYVNDIPSNELEKWLKLESERFKMLVLRLFHTELEAVYEEFNISQDVDTRKGNKAIREALYPNHQYGTQTTIGEGEHLKNPSHVKIQEYFNKYYVPNNMGIVVSGDFNPDEMVALVEKYFGDYKSKPVPVFKHAKQPEITKPIVTEVFGKEQAYADLAYRIEGGAGSQDEIITELITGILFNRQAGLMDINLNQKQKVLESDAWMWSMDDYCTFGLYGKPREGQTLQEVKQLMLGQLDKVKKGQFDDWLIKAVIKDKKLSQIKGLESNQGRAGAMTTAFITQQNWGSMAKKFARMEKVTKAEIVAFANKYFNDNYVIIYKKEGKDKNVYKVDKPSITPIPLNREAASPFIKKFNATGSEKLSPVFVNYKQDIKAYTLNNGVKMEYVKNTSNETFSLFYILEMGSNHDKELALAIQYLPYLGTNKYTAEQLQQEFFKLGVSFDVFSGDERVYVTLSGLEESLEEGVQLFEHILANVKPDKVALEGVVKDNIKKRNEAKKDRRTILRGGMVNYAKYGKKSPFTDKLTEQKLKALKADALVAKIKGLTGYKHNIFYYGAKSSSDALTILNKYHKVPASLKDYPKPTVYPELNTKKDKVVFVDFPIVQADILLLSKGTPQFNLEERLMSELYNNYFGFGLSSIVFQEIRESKALAYSAYAYYGSPRKKDKAHYLQAYVGTQVDKLKDAVNAMEGILEDMPVSKDQIESARQSILKKIESERTTGTDVYWSSKRNKDLGYEKDIREDLYKKMQTVTQDNLLDFQKKNVKNRNFTYLVMGDKKKVDMDFLSTIGEVEELSLEDLFGY